MGSKKRVRKARKRVGQIIDTFSQISNPVFTGLLMLWSTSSMKRGVKQHSSHRHLSIGIEKLDNVYLYQMSMASLQSEHSNLTL